MDWVGDPRHSDGVVERGFELKPTAGGSPASSGSPTAPRAPGRWCSSATAPRPTSGPTTWWPSPGGWPASTGSRRRRSTDRATATAGRPIATTTSRCSATSWPSGHARGRPTTSSPTGPPPSKPCAELPEVGDGPLGYWGLSMGTIYGLPFVAAEPRVQVAVFGLMGLVGPTRDRLEADARRLACPVLFLQQWHDSLIPREHVAELFDALGRSTSASTRPPATTPRCRWRSSSSRPSSWPATWSQRRPRSHPRRSPLECQRMGIVRHSTAIHAGQRPGAS